LKPGPQRFARSLEDRTRGWRGLALAGRAPQQASGCRPSMVPITSRTPKAVRPPKSLQIFSARLLGAEPRVKFLKCPRVINSADRRGIMAHHYILRLRERNG
jgi:hypothetical protein